MHEAMEHRVREHYTRYVDLLDEHAWAGWLELFAADARYQITTRDNDLRGLPAGVMLCSNRAMLADRVDAGRLANIYRQHVNRHLLGQASVQVDGDVVRVQCPFCVVQTAQGGMPFIFAVGKYRDELVEADGQLVIRSKAVILDNSRIMTSLPLPL